jgi:SAM-dependent methyltransferase
MSCSADAVHATLNAMHIARPAMTEAAVISALRDRVAIDDAAFDRLYPDAVARLSIVHWTPVAVALRAAALLAPIAGMRVLDIGAGAGKLCCLGAVAHAGTWHGIERDPSLVAAAAEVARRLDVGHCTRFAAGDALAADWRGFDSLYLYNPFESQRFGGGFARASGDAGFSEQVSATEARLRELAPGTRVVTFHGFGGEMPEEFALATLEEVDGGELALWIKRTGPGPGSRRR